MTNNERTIKLPEKVKLVVEAEIPDDSTYVSGFYLYRMSTKSYSYEGDYSHPKEKKELLDLVDRGEVRYEGNPKGSGIDEVIKANKRFLRPFMLGADKVSYKEAIYQKTSDIVTVYGVESARRNLEYSLTTSPYIEKGTSPGFRTIPFPGIPL